MDGLDDKLIVEDIGPFTYVEKVEKVNVVYNDNDTISYRVSFLPPPRRHRPNNIDFIRLLRVTQEHRSFIFQPHLSEGKQYAQVTVPNIPMLTAAAKMRYASFFSSAGINIALSTTKSRPFKVRICYFRDEFPVLLIEISSLHRRYRLIHFCGATQTNWWIYRNRWPHSVNRCHSTNSECS